MKKLISVVLAFALITCGVVSITLTKTTHMR